MKDQNYPGLCMSRSFGDECLKSCGVTSEPEISGPESLDYSREPFMVCCSDGPRKSHRYLGFGFF